MREWQREQIARTEEERSIFRGKVRDYWISIGFLSRTNSAPHCYPLWDPEPERRVESERESERER